MPLGQASVPEGIEGQVALHKVSPIAVVTFQLVWRFLPRGHGIPAVGHGPTKMRNNCYLRMKITQRRSV